jgi:hypothetical protein
MQITVNPIPSFDFTNVPQTKSTTVFVTVSDDNVSGVVSGSVAYAGQSTPVDVPVSFNPTAAPTFTVDADAVAAALGRPAGSVSVSVNNAVETSPGSWQIGVAITVN